MPRPRRLHVAPSKSHVVILINYLRRHHVLVFDEIRKRVGKLSVLVSTRMEPNRNWVSEWDDLDVQIQKNLMYTAKWRHSAGFVEENYIHVPIDTVSQLRKLQPDVVFSYEMGLRTLLSSRYCYSQNIPLVMVGNMSNFIESERGTLRRLLRKWMLRSIDFATFNGPSCRDYLRSIGVAEDNLFHFPYAYDPDKAFPGQRKINHDEERRILFCGELGQRKGILNFTEVLRTYAGDVPNSQMRLTVAGDGPLKNTIADLACPNLVIEFLGSCNPEQLSKAYSKTDICIFPTLADEWGLVPIEAMKSGVPVLGSMAAQSIESLGKEGENGWFFDPQDKRSIYDGIERAIKTSPERLITMGEFARNSVAHISPLASAKKFVEVLSAITQPEIEESHSLIPAN